MGSRDDHAWRRTAPFIKIFTLRSFCLMLEYFPNRTSKANKRTWINISESHILARHTLSCMTPNQLDSLQTVVDSYQRKECSGATHQAVPPLGCPWRQRDEV